jgi:hypothetical protein
MVNLAKSRQYPYLLQSVYWAQELGLSVIIDFHGVPGSQNGQDNSGLIGPVLFPSNTSNVDRSLGVLQNLSVEFGREIYGGVVKSACDGLVVSFDVWGWEFVEGRGRKGIWKNQGLRDGRRCMYSRSDGSTSRRPI